MESTINNPKRWDSLGPMQGFHSAGGHGTFLCNEPICRVQKRQGRRKEKQKQILPEQSYTCVGPGIVSQKGVAQPAFEEYSDNVDVIVLNSMSHSFICPIRG